MSPRTAATLAFAGSRIAYGAALLARPRPTARNWLGDGLDSAGGRVGARGLGARDALISAGLLDALRRDSNPVPWLLALAASDLVDIGATIVDRDGLPERAAPATVALAGTFCAFGLALAAAHRDR